MSDNVQRGHRHPFEPSREFLSCNVAGFGHWDGVLIFDKLEPGTHLKLEAEPDNPYDARAIALYYKDTKIGFIPRDMNLELSPLLFFGHEFDLLPALCFIPFLTKEEIIGGITRREVGLRICLDEFTAGIDQIRAGSEGSHLFIQENFLLPKAEFESQLRWCEEFLERVKADQYELAEKSCWPGPLVDAKTEPRPSD